ncbi:MAG: hypothetical protein MUE40_00800 [Anaerolineae bacterium]|jgi:hypothetical protein|nr:hypothetical protein [Anaerolineae bacterium]
MIKRIFGELPVWAQSNHPLLRYELFRQKSHRSRPRRLLLAALHVLLVLALLLAGYLIATDFLRRPAGINLTGAIWQVLYFPALVVQVALSVFLIATAADAISDERRRQTWDNLRATATGAEMTLRTRWVALFYRVQRLIALLLAVRLVLAGAALVELTSHRGGYLDLLTATITPEVGLPAAVALMAATLTAAFLLPLTGIGIEIALSLLIAAAIRSRTAAVVLQILLIVFKLALVVGLHSAMQQFLAGTLPPLPEGLPWLLVLAFSAFSDQGLLLMQPGYAGELWAIVPYSVFAGAALLLFILVQALLTDGIMAYAVRRAERNE